MSQTLNISELIKRPGIIINEIDASVRQFPAQTQLQNLVIGFSRKGPINKAVLIQTPQQLLQTFGDVDRQMEKKGSFFHRTILNILNNAPVWAMNLLSTDDQLDTLEYKSISFASNVINSTVKSGSYSRFFNRADFWYRDTDDFLTLTKGQSTDNNLIFHITNMSDKKTSVFMFKSTINGYDDTLESYYGGVDNVPVYLHPKDQIKDYMVAMLIVSGDWSDYKALSVDPRWSQYFNTSGLRKDKVSSFYNDKAVNVLRFYSDLCIIPYFRDINNRVLFIESVVNTDTDSHGIFVTYDIEKVEASDYSTGLLDLIGSNLVGENPETIEYLSYKESIVENILFKEEILNRFGNAFGNYNINMELKLNTTSPNTIVVPGANSDLLFLTGLDSYILGGQLITTSSSGVNIPNVSLGKIRKDTLYVDSNGVLGTVAGFEVSNQTQWTNVPLKPLTTGLLPVGIVQIGTFGTNGNMGIDSAATTLLLNNLTIGTSTSSDILISYFPSAGPTANQLTLTFADTKNSDGDFLYRKTRLNMIFNVLQSNLLPGLSISKIGSTKSILNNIQFVTSADQNKSVTITVAPNENIKPSNPNLPELYFIDNELSFKGTSNQVSLGTKTTSDTSGNWGIASKNSKLYKQFVTGNINTGDYFYPNLFNYTFQRVEFYKQSGNDIIDFYFNNVLEIDTSKLTNRKIKLFGTLANDNIFTVLNVNISNSSIIGYALKVSVIVSQSIKTEILIGSVEVCGASESDIRYLKMYLINDNLVCEYTQSADLIGNNSLDVTPIPAPMPGFNLSSIRLFSGKTSYKQTLEVETVITSNKILVSTDRYGVVKIGDYLEALVDTNTLQIGEVPKKLTRIIDKILYAGDSTLTQITTDASIKIDIFGGVDMQTTRYTTIENYVNTYNATVLSGFKMRADSMPDGTEARQNKILNLISAGTPLFKGLINRNKLSWRYLVDCWGNGLTSNSKQQLVDLCGARLTALGLLNMPSARAFKNSTATSFIDPKTKTLRTDFIKLGGDPNSSPSFLYNFGQGVGQSNVAFFFPFLTIDDGSRPLDMPPASYICNTFMRKHLSRLSSVKPWTVAAGLTNGGVTGFGNTEMDFTPDDVSELNQMNANPITYKMNRGFVIETNNTAQLTPRSSLSYINAREVLIELENEMYEMLLTYQWQFNTSEIRTEIKNRADAICQRYVREQGLYNYLNIMDETNNTSELIDAQIGVIDTFVEITKGMGVIVNNITILKTGDIQIGGFRLPGQ